MKVPALLRLVGGSTSREHGDGPGRVLVRYAIHYDAHRPHQSPGQRSSDAAVPAPIIDLAGTQVRRRPVLGGLINEYEAA